MPNTVGSTYQPRSRCCGPAAAGGEGRTLLDAFGDVAQHPVALALGDQRAHVRGRVERIAHPDLREVGGQGLDELVVSVAGDDDPGQGGADLARQEALGSGQGPGRGLDLHVVEDDRRRLAPELQCASGDALAAERGDSPAGGGGSGERDLVDPPVTHEQLGHLPIGGENVQHARGQADRLRHLGDDVGLPGCLRRGLEHHRAAGEQRRCDLVGDETERRVPRDDRTDHTDGLADEQTELPSRGRGGRLLEGE